MKLKVVLICLLTIGFLSSCNSKKQVVHSKHKIQPTEKKVVAAKEKSKPADKIIETKPNTTKEDGTILFTIKKGYTINNKLLRPAEIITVKN